MEECSGACCESHDKATEAFNKLNDAKDELFRQKIDRVLNASNSFEVLELPVQETSVQDIVKAHRTLSVFVDPGKAPADYRDKATEAFNKLKDAKAELLESKKQVI